MSLTRLPLLLAALLLCAAFTAPAAFAQATGPTGPADPAPGASPAGTDDTDDTGGTDEPDAAEECGNYGSPTEAQDAFDMDPQANAVLDGDGDEEACEDYDYAATTGDAADECGDYTTREAAQEAYDADRTGNAVLDQDQDGDACEDYDFANSTADDGYPVGGVDTGGPAPGTPAGVDGVTDSGASTVGLVLIALGAILALACGVVLTRRRRSGTR